jgi:hypothetical protein
MDNSIEQLRRARKTALVLATFSVICLLSMVYAFIQKGESDKQAKKIQDLSKELELCNHQVELKSDSTTLEIN